MDLVKSSYRAALRRAYLVIKAIQTTEVTLLPEEGLIRNPRGVGVGAARQEGQKGETRLQRDTPQKTPIVDPVVRSHRLRRRSQTPAILAELPLTTQHSL